MLSQRRDQRLLACRLAGSRHRCFVCSRCVQGLYLARSCLAPAASLPSPRETCTGENMRARHCVCARVSDVVAMQPQHRQQKRNLPLSLRFQTSCPFTRTSKIPPPRERDGMSDTRAISPSNVVRSSWTRPPISVSSVLVTHRRALPIVGGRGRRTLQVTCANQAARSIHRQPVQYSISTDGRPSSSGSGGEADGSEKGHQLQNRARKTRLTTNTDPHLDAPSLRPAIHLQKARLPCACVGVFVGQQRIGPGLLLRVGAQQGE